MGYPVVGGPYDGEVWSRYSKEMSRWVGERYRYIFHASKWKFDGDNGREVSAARLQDLLKRAGIKNKDKE